MKKIGLLMSMASVLVVGGVYATWVYSQGTVDSVTADYTVAMTTSTNDGEKGSFNVASNSVTFEVGNKGEYHPELRSNGQVDVTFTPSLGASTDVINNGINIKASLSISDDGATNWMYDSDFADGKDKLFFTITNSDIIIDKSDLTKVGGSFKYTISHTQIFNLITFNVADNFVLDTKEKYDSFKSYLDDYKFVLTISEYTGS